jgi:NhaP-type Na+/H+ or K+/H+ antiporter
MSSSSNEDRDSKTTQIFFLCFSGILVLVLFLSKYLEDSPRLRTVLSEPAMTLLIGIFFSFIVRILNEADYEAYEDNYEEYQASMQQVTDDDTDDYMNNNNNNNNYYYDETPTEAEYIEELPQFFLWFPNKVFFMALLPPILFNSGYQLQRELFYRHFAAITLFSCLGTCISAFGAGGFLIVCRNCGLLGQFNPTTMELLTYGALIAATDTVSIVGVLQRKRVDPHLFSLVFGESALNDAVAIVLFKTLADFLTKNSQGVNEGESLGLLIGKYLLDLCIQTIVSPILGLVFASLMGLAFKYCDFREHRLLELSLYILPVYIPFILSEILDLSGMITIFFTGIFARRYMEPNVSAPTREYSGILFQLFSFLAEICIFLELGLSVFGLHKSYYFQFISWAFMAALLGRALSVYPLSIIFNFSLTRPVTNISPLSCVDPTTTTTAVDDDTNITNSRRTTSSTVYFDMDDDGIVDTSTNNHNNNINIPSPSSTDPNSTTPPPTTATNTAKTLPQSKKGGGDGYLLRRETPVRKQDKIIPTKFMHLLWFAGLRGAVAYACAREFPDVYGHKDGFIAATMVIVLVTIVLMGGATEPLMECLKIRMNVDEEEYMKEWHKQRKLKGRFLHFGTYRPPQSDDDRSM